jgi:hypothetical protein
VAQKVHSRGTEAAEVVVLELLAARVARRVVVLELLLRAGAVALQVAPQLLPEAPVEVEGPQGLDQLIPVVVQQVIIWLETLL